MGVKEVATGATLIRKLYAEKMLREAGYLTYFDKFTSTTKGGNVVWKERMIKKGGGETVTFGLVKKLQGAGVTDSTPLSGNEEPLSDTNDSMTLGIIRHGVIINKLMSAQRSLYDQEKEAREALKIWFAEKLDQMHFDALFTFPSSTKILYQTSSAFSGTNTEATAKTAMDATNSKLTPALLTKLKAWADTGGNRAYEPIMPVRVDGGNYHILLVHPNATVDLKNDTTYQAGIREARERGEKNPLFRGSDLVWDNLIVHSHEKVPMAADGGGASVSYCKGMLLGAQALTRIDGMAVDETEEWRDHKQTLSIGAALITAIKKPQWNIKGTARDQNSVGVFVACQNYTAA